MIRVFHEMEAGLAASTPILSPTRGDAKERASKLRAAVRNEATRSLEQAITTGEGTVSHHQAAGLVGPSTTMPVIPPEIPLHLLAGSPPQSPRLGPPGMSMPLEGAVPPVPTPLREQPYYAARFGM